MGRPRSADDVSRESAPDFNGYVFAPEGGSAARCRTFGAAGPPHERRKRRSRPRDRPRLRHLQVPTRGRAGAALYDALASASRRPQDDVALAPVECLSVCKRPCTVAFAGPGKWTYVVGDLDAARPIVEDIVIDGRAEIRGDRRRPHSVARAPAVVSQRRRFRARRRSLALSSESLTMLAKTPVTIVTGFLGSGKTTLIRHVLAHAHGRRLALIINEFGDVGVDGDILKSCGDASCPRENIVELANGCICCTVADDFAPAIDGAARARTKPDHIVIETSGLALPKPLVKAFDWPELRAKLTVDGVIAVVDAAAVAEGRFADDPEAIAANASPIRRSTTTIRSRKSTRISCCAPTSSCSTRPILSRRRSSRASRAEIARAMPRAVKIIETREGRDRARRAARREGRRRRRSGAAALPPRCGGGHDHDDFDTFVVDLPGVARSRRFRRAPRRSRRSARNPAHEGLSRRRRQADAAARAGRRTTVPPRVRSAVAAGERRGEPPGGDRPKGRRPGAVAAALGA